MTTIYGMQDSGNCYKPRLLCALIGRPFRHVDIRWDDGGTSSETFLAMNPVGKVPLLELDDGRRLPESNAMLCYLGAFTPYVPGDPFEHAEMLAWMFFEQYSHEPNIAVRRSLLLYPKMADRATPARLADTLAGGTKALAVMETQLSEADWFVGSRPSLADIALYAYTHVAEDGGFGLGAFPAVRAWLARVEGLDGFRPMTWLPNA